MNLKTDLYTIPNKIDNYAVKGLNDTAFSLYVNQIFETKKKNILVLTPTLFEANKILSDLSNLNNQTFLFPMDDFLTSMALAMSPDFKVTRLETINSLLNSEKHVVVTHLMGFLRFLPEKKLYQESIIRLKVGTMISPSELVQKLANIGYVRDTFVYKTTDMAVRGYIIDVFPISSNNPVRIEFFGDEIESLRYFDVETQKSLNTIDNIEIYPASEFLLEQEHDDIDTHQYNLVKYNQHVVSIVDYLDDVVLVIKDFNQLKNSYLEIKEQMMEYQKEQDSIDMSFMHDFKKIDLYPKIHYLSHDSLISNLNLDNIFDFGMKEVVKFHENIDGIEKYLNDHRGKTIILALKDYQIRSFTKNLNVPYVITKYDALFPNKINIIPLEMDSGFVYQNVIVITDRDLFDIERTHKKYRTKFKYSSRIQSIDKLAPGDYVVHDVNGIGVYNGIKVLKLNGIVKDYLEILYKGNDKLYIPVEKINLVSKFSGKEGMKPKINSLNSNEWHRTKIRVANKVHNIASELLHIYAMREMQKGFKYDKDDELQLMFEQEFEYSLTPDQVLAIKQIKDEMETSHPMDRLLCGDVGFGKTEVAFRAIFKAIMNGKQVIYLCPTTILSMQQYNNALSRFKNFPVNIALLNRFVSPKEVNKTINGFSKGTVDLLIGTHRVLSDDIKPRDLGLLVIDEEQRFGVTHKEKIKKYKNDVDVLTLTATPIPRTLQMSLVGIRSLSLITTPPHNRYPIQTYVLEENNNLIKDAIYKELSRNGQVFILYNHIDLIERKVYEINSLVPEAKVIYAHGQMDKTAIENKMMDFVLHKADVLVCTTIIETGIDIPNVNTLIILEADHFGLSQLYQIRGRVGRSDKIAYAYMMYSRGKVLNDDAVKRLKAIEEFTELGSGFKIANRDLSIRGAGDLLGSEQAGFIDSVGIDLYLRILNEEVRKLKGETIEEKKEDDTSLINVSTHINDDYVAENDIKIEIHHMINSIDSYDKLVSIRKEIEDRFGKIDAEMEVYMYEEWFEKLAKRVGVSKIKETKTSVELIFSPDVTSTIDGEKLFIDAYNISPYFKFQYHNKCLGIILSIVKLEKHYVYYLIDLLNTIVK